MREYPGVTPHGNSLVLRATFISPRPGFTPRLKGYTLIEWGKSATGQVTGSFYSKKLPAKNPTARATLSPVVTLNGGTIDWYLSNDGGVTWIQTNPGQPVHFLTWGGADVRVRADITCPDGQPLSPVIEGYTLVTSDAVSASQVEARMKIREIEALKDRLEIDALRGAVRHRLLQSVTDTFTDDSGIDPVLSSGYAFDDVNKLIYAADGSATVVSKPELVPLSPSMVFFTAQENLGSGSITYWVSRDDGVTWNQLNKDDLTDISGQPQGTQIRIKAVITGDAQLLGWGWGWI